MGHWKFLWGVMTGLAALLAPVQGLILCAAAFVAVDFATGVAASRRRARRGGEAWRFSSRRAWDTVLKLVFAMAGIVLAWMLDSVVITFVELHLAKLFTGFVCGVEFWSYLENASDISGQPIFRAFADLLKRKIDRLVKK
jgi:phage-related holin